MDIANLIIGVLGLLASGLAYLNTRNIKNSMKLQLISEKLAAIKSVLENSQVYLSSNEIGNLYGTILEVSQKLAILLEIAKDKKNLFENNVPSLIEEVRQYLTNNYKSEEYSFDKIVCKYQSIIAIIDSWEAKHHENLY